jgi:GrpB-like predicted nucleotidyltransferase (UPF0157 family)
LRIEDVGSTAVPGLPAKPIIDIALVVADAAREQRYVPVLEQAGYRLRIREPEWFEHRMCTDHDGTANLHVFSAGCDEVERMTRFRDWLRRNPADRDLYARRQARTGGASLGVRPGVRRRQERRDRSDPGALVGPGIAPSLTAQLNAIRGFT